MTERSRLVPLVAIVGVALAVGVIVYLIVGAASGQPAPTLGGQPVITGTFTLTDADVLYNPSHETCTGTGGYGDIAVGTDVVVRDGTGTIVGAGRLAWSPASAIGSCVFTFAVPVKDTDFYSIEVSHRGDLTYSKADLAARGWAVAASLGD